MLKNSDWQPRVSTEQPETARYGACRDCPRLIGTVYSWKQTLAFTTCIMGVLVVLSAALAVILPRLHPY